MVSAKASGKKGQPSIKHSSNVAEARRKLSKLSDHAYLEYAYAFQKHNRKQGETKLSQILSKDALISAVDLLWDRSDFVSANFVSSLKEGNLDDLNGDEVSEFKFSAGSARLPVDKKAQSHLPSTPQPRVKLLRVAEKMCIFYPYDQNYYHSFLSWFNQTNRARSIRESCKENGFLFEARWETEKNYSWMQEMLPTFSRYHKGEAEIEKRENFEDRITNPFSHKEECASRNANSCDCVFCTREGGSIQSEPKSPHFASVAESLVDNRISRSSDAKSLFLLYKDRCANNKAVSTISSKCSMDCHSEISSARNNPDKEILSKVENKQLPERDRKDQQTELCSSSEETPRYGVAKQRHAFAGALAGVSVSLCLHPLDTVKTMIQSCRLEEKSLCSTGRSIISERGFSGLYRGIASNIASSAPISALYTFTYETVKGALLPRFPKEYCSLTHCVAGGSASFATSFIFTPSERIKQQMQVSSHYRNCWTALVGIVQKGGLLSLYDGWSAVLCRNIPHSIIKLVCGGLAGSAAAFFTTPFDVVKTRLQTQIPGSRNQNPSVYQTLQSIGKQEGLRGLYRGLIPRLVMYMSQGAIFFASYEFYKSVLALEAAQPSSSPLSGTKQKMEIALNH